MTNLALGIDLGTTNSCVCAFFDGELKTIVNQLGTNVTPSYVAIEEDGDFIVGDPAKGQIGIRPQGHTIYDVKRIIGRRFNDPALQKKIKEWPFKVQEIDGAPVIAVNGKNYYPEQISARVLWSLMDSAVEKLQIDSINKAVITVPAYFNDGQRQATKDAGALAGLDVLRIVNEPTAAAIAYVYHQSHQIQEGRRNLLVFDLGGGTFDISILSVDQNNIIVQAVGGDTNLGGGDFDTELLRFCMDEFRTVHGEKFKTVETRRDSLTLNKLTRFRERTRAQCERQKEFLAKTQKVKVTADGVFDGLDLSVTITRERFNELNDPYFRRCIDIMAQVIKDAGMEPSGIDDVVLVGGSTRIPKIQEMITAFFGGRRPSTILNAAEAIAQGAALLAALLVNDNRICRRDNRIFKMRFTDVLPMSLGTDVLRDQKVTIVTKIINKNTPVPCSQMKKFYPAKDGQKTTTFCVFEGEEEDPGKNYKLGTFTYELPEMYRKKKISHSAQLTVSSEGIIDLIVSFPEVGRSKKFQVVADKGRLSKEQLMHLRVEGSETDEVSPALWY